MCTIATLATKILKNKYVVFTYNIKIFKIVSFFGKRPKLKTQKGEYENPNKKRRWVNIFNFLETTKYILSNPQTIFLPIIGS